MDQSTTDVIIVGAGPIGLETAADILAAGLDCVILEAGSVGQTIADWPSDTPFFSSPERCAVAGVPIQNQHQSMLRGEEYLSYLRQVVEIRDLPVFTYTPVQTIKRTSDGFVLTAGPEGLVRGIQESIRRSGHREYESAPASRGTRRKPAPRCSPIHRCPSVLSTASSRCRRPQFRRGSRDPMLAGRSGGDRQLPRTPLRKEETQQPISSGNQHPHR
jgi:hypothetical protein